MSELIVREVEEGALVTILNAQWVLREKGNVCYGKLLGRYEVNGSVPESHYYYQIALLKECKVLVDRDCVGEIVVAKKGEVVNLGETRKIAFLNEVEIPEIRAQAEYLVWIYFKDKVDVSGGPPVWEMEVSTRRVKAPVKKVLAL
jgi:hypothetical protein